MAGDFDLSARITADASGLVAAGAQGEKALDGVAGAGRRATVSTDELTESTTKTAKAIVDLTGIEGRLDKVLASLERNTAVSAQGFGTLTTALQATQTSAASMGRAVEQAATEQERAATAARDQALAEQRLVQATSDAERAQAAAALAALKLQQAQEGNAAATNKLGRDMSDLRAQLDPVGEAERRLAQAIDLANTALARGIITQEQYEKHLHDLTNASKVNQAELNRHAFGVRNLGQQFGDLGLSIAGGISPARAFGQQAGQIGYALSEMGGKAGAVGAFLTGPWGIALTIGIAVLAPFVEKLLEGGDAADTQAKKLAQAATAADSYGTAQSLLGKVIDLTTGKLKTQNQVLIQTIKLQAQSNLLAAQKEEKTARDALRDVAKPTFFERVKDSFTSAAISDQGGSAQDATSAAQATARALQPVKDVVRDYIELTKIAGASQSSLDRGLDATLRRIDALAKVGRLAGRDAIDAKAAVLGLATTLNDQKANQLVLDALDGKGVDAALKPYEKPKKGKKPKSTEAVEEFGRDAATKIADIVGQFDDAPAAIDKANAKVRELDDLIEDLNRKKPTGFETLARAAEAAKFTVREGLIREVAKAFEQPKTLAQKASAAISDLDAVIADLSARKPVGFGKLIEDAKAAEDVIRDGLQKPYRDFITDQEAGLEVQRLMTAGRVDEANALKIVQGLEKGNVALTGAQKDAVLATVQAVRAEQRELEIRNQLNAKYIEALGSIKGAVEDATQAFARGDLGQFIKSPKKLLDAFQTLQGRALFDKLFGGLFRDLEDQINGTSSVKDAADRMADAVDEVSRQTDKTTAALDNLAASANRAATGVTAQPSGAGSIVAPAAAVGGGALASLLNSVADNDSRIAQALGTRPAPVAGEPGDIVVTAPKRVDPTKLFGDALGGVATKITSVFTNPDSAGRIGKFIGTNAGKALGGAAEGAAINSVFKPIANALGLKTSSTGAQIGGAIGSFLPIPGGQVIGSLAGGIIGGLFKKTVKGGVSITGVDQSSYSGSGKLSEALTGNASGVQSTISQIAQALGADVGSFGVAIGKNGDYYHVSGSANGDVSAKHPKIDVLYEGKDEAEAIAIAVQNAIADGAVKGLSAAVQKALASSSDTQAALTEALKVREVETLIGGLGASLKTAFDAFDSTAKERLRIAQQYGLDVAAIEKINAEQRVKLVDDTLKARVGSLTDFLSSIKYGDLFEGTAAEKRAALQKEIAVAQADAEAGKDGAADKLAQLSQQLLATSRDAYGTAGGQYAADRASAITGVDRVIQMETDRVNAAAGIGAATTAAVEKVAALTDETNALTAISNARLQEIVNGLASLGASGGGFDYASTIRASSLV